jgi:hypothetical protein
MQYLWQHGPSVSRFTIHPKKNGSIGRPGRATIIDMLGQGMNICEAIYEHARHR